jgi:hypothetical protein
MVQVVLQKDLAPSQTRAPGWPACRHPGALLPLVLRDSAGQVRQGRGGRFPVTNVTADPLDLRPHLVVTPLERRTLDLQKKLHVQRAHPAPNSALLP